jgi:hypothetical protein
MSEIRGGATRRNLLMLGGLALGSGAMASAALAVPGNEHHPGIHAAIHALKKAAVDIKEAPHDFGGHRAEALAAVDKAIEQLEICLKHERK